MGTQVGALILLWGLPGWKGSWRAASLAASFLFHVAASILMFPSLTTQSLDPTTTTTTLIWVMAQPPDPIQEGGNVTFVPQMSSKDFSRCSWYRERTGNLQELIMSYGKGNFEFYVTGEASTGRETIVPDCSLHIRSLLPADGGVYTVRMDKGGRILAIGHVILMVVETSHWSPLPQQDGNFVTIMVGTFGGVVALFILIGLSFWFCARCQKNSRPPAGTIPPSAPPPLPPPLSPPPSYENIFPLGHVGPWVDATAPLESVCEVSGTSQHSVTKNI